MESKVQTVLGVGDWMEKKLKTTAGSFILGLLLGIILVLPSVYGLYKEREKNYDTIAFLDEKILSLENDNKELQEKALQAQAESFAKIKEMASFFQDLGDIYTEKEIDNRQQVDTEASKIQDLKKVRDDLTVLKDKVDGYN